MVNGLNSAGVIMKVGILKIQVLIAGVGKPHVLRHLEQQMQASMSVWMAIHVRQVAMVVITVHLVAQNGVHVKMVTLLVAVHVLIVMQTAARMLLLIISSVLQTVLQ